MFGNIQNNTALILTPPPPPQKKKSFSYDAGIIKQLLTIIQLTANFSLLILWARKCLAQDIEELSAVIFPFGYVIELNYTLSVKRNL